MALCQRHPSMQKNDCFLPCCSIVDRLVSIWTPRAGCLIAFSLGFSCIVLCCFQCFIFLTSDWATTDVGPVLLAPSFVLSCSSWSVFFRWNHVMASLLSSASTAHYVSMSSPFVVSCILSTVCLLSWFPAFRLWAQRSVMVPQSSLSIVLALLVP